MPSREGLRCDGSTLFSQFVSTHSLICSNVSQSGPGILRVCAIINPRTTGFFGASRTRSMKGPQNTSSILHLVLAGGTSVITALMVVSFLFVGFKFAEVGHELVGQDRYSLAVHPRRFHVPEHIQMLRQSRGHKVG